MDRGQTELSQRRSVRYDGIGAMLRDARVRDDLEIGDVARQLRIRKAYLEAIEQGLFRDLPGITYAIGYVRSYAEFLGLDKNRAVDLFKQESSELAEPTTLSFPSPAPEGKVPGGALVFVSALLAIALYAGWYYATSENKTLADIIPDIPERFSTLLAENSVPDAAKPDASQPGATSSVAAVDADAREARAETATTPDEAFSETDLSADTGLNAAPLGGTAAGGDSTATGVTVASADTPSASEGSSTAQDTFSLNPAQASLLPAPDTAVSNTAGAGAATSGEQRAADAQAAPGADAAAQSGFPQTSNSNDVRPATTDTAVATSTGLTASAEETASAETLVAAAAIPAAPSMAQGTATVPSVAETTIIIRATGDSWVQIRDADSAPVMTRIMRDGDEYRVPGRSGLTLLTGNAGALEITVNGERVARLGDFGEVVRNVSLDHSLLDRLPR